MSVVQTAFHLPAVTALKGTIREMRDRAQTNWRTWCRERVYSDTMLSGFGRDALRETLCHVFCQLKREASQ